MRHKNILVGLLAVTMLAGTSAAAAVTPSTTTQPTPPPRYQLVVSPFEAEPGGQVHVTLRSEAPLDGTCHGPATSPGFVAPIELNLASHTTYAGEGPVITKPGEYVASVTCNGGGTVTTNFKIVDGRTSPPDDPTAPTTPTTPTAPPVVTPVGPPQTGGGGTAFGS